MACGSAIISVSPVSVFFNGAGDDLSAKIVEFISGAANTGDDICVCIYDFKADRMTCPLQNGPRRMLGSGEDGMEGQTSLGSGPLIAASQSGEAH